MGKVRRTYNVSLSVYRKDLIGCYGIVVLHKEVMNGFKVGVRLHQILALIHADDIVMCSESKEQVKESRER